MACSICLDTLSQDSEVSSTPCGHLFHSACLNRATEATKTCPSCRSSCNQRVSIHRVYLSLPSEQKVWTEREKDYLQTFAKDGSLEWYKKMTESSDDKNPANQFGWTPLHSAAKHGQIKICQFILENIRNKLPKDQFGKTPMDVAAENGNWNVCAFFPNFVTLE